MPTFRTSRSVSAADAGKPHLILVGLPGSGKSTVGQALAEKLGRGFLDFDLEIERREHDTIAEIFAMKGEPHFRKLERGLTEECAQVGNMVLAPGAGWITNPGCLEMLRPPGLLVYLKVRPETAVKHMGADVVQRPLLRRADPVGEVRHLLEVRETLYAQADHTVSADMMSLSVLVDRIVALATV